MSTVDISLQPTETWVAENRSWLGSRDGTEVTQSITLATSTFTEGTHYPDGYVKSGTLLGEITAVGATQGMYGPYDNAASDGRETAVGFLFSSVKMRASGPNVGAAIHWRGVIRAAKLPTNHGLDANARTELAAKFWIR
jgi:hypothetical protein